MIGETLSERCAEVLDNIAAACGKSGRDPSEVRLVAVTKTQPPETVSEAVREGLRILGENRVQEALAKAPLCPSAEWHLIGPLQRNKIRHALRLFTTLHAVDSVDVLRDLGRISEETGARPDVLLEVNVAGEATKHGFTAESVRAAVEQTLADGALRLTGLMTIPPFVTDPELSRPRFSALRGLRDSLETEFGISLPELSMGMSADYAVAVEEGATFVRVGTALFGPRAGKAWKPVRTPDSDSYWI